jgi:hypothetical protein
MGATRSNRRPRRVLLGWCLLTEATIWTGYCVWVAVRLWSVGGPSAYILGSLTVILAALPVLIGGAALVRGSRPMGLSLAVLLTCLALSLVLNVVLSSSAFFLGLGVEPSLDASTRALFFGVSGVCVFLGAGALGALRSHRRTDATRR